MKTLVAMLTTLCIGVTTVSFGVNAFDELDPVVDQGAPQGLVVHIAPDGGREVFKTSLDQGIINNDAAAAAALTKAIKEENKVESVAPLSELDRTSSDDSWNWVWNMISNAAGYFSYKYRHQGRSYDYYPSYSYSWSGHQYSYYYNSNCYGNSYSYNYSESYGYHHSSGHGRNHGGGYGYNHGSGHGYNHGGGYGHNHGGGW
ncbi:MAG: hypothetical protein HQK53_09940 [Oligoflexia bacterium]|nr:hypothetical protein [Oligoflexia bacterium]